MTLGTGAARLNMQFQIASYRLLNFSFDVDISLWEFEFFIKKNTGDRLKVFSKTLSDGISFPIYSDTSIDVELSASETLIEEGEYYYELRRTDNNTPLICGYAYFNFDARQGDESSIELSVTDSVITVTVSNVSNGELPVYETTSLTTLTPDLDSYSAFEITAQGESLTVANPTGTIGNFDGFPIRITDDGTPQVINYGNQYRAFGEALPTTTTVGKTLYLICIRNTTYSVFDTASREEI